MSPSKQSKEDVGGKKRCINTGGSTYVLQCAVCKCFAINLASRRMTGSFDAVRLFSRVPAESYFHRMLCMHFSDRLLQETGAQEGSRRDWNEAWAIVGRMESNRNAVKSRTLAFIWRSLWTKLTCSINQHKRCSLNITVSNLQRHSYQWHKSQY